jgi:hypothetical protein
MASPLLTDLLIVVADVQNDFKDEDVTAGWTAFAIFLLLIVAMAVLGFSLTKQLKKAQAAKDAGVFDDPADAGATGTADPAGTAETEKHEAP